MATKKDSLRLLTLDVADPDDDASAVSTLASVELVKYAPTHAPVSWLVINCALFIWSLVLVFEIAVDSTLHPLERTQLYLLWNFGSTFCWCTEVVLSALAHAQESNKNDVPIENSWATILELALAIYFTTDSIHLFRKWKRGDKDIQGELLDSTVNMIAYCYQVLKAKPLSLLRTRERHQKYELIV